jgi:hypothetical protein
MPNVGSVKDACQDLDGRRYWVMQRDLTCYPCPASIPAGREDAWLETVKDVAYPVLDIGDGKGAGIRIPQGPVTPESVLTLEVVERVVAPFVALGGRLDAAWQFDTGQPRKWPNRGHWGQYLAVVISIPTDCGLWEDAEVQHRRIEERAWQARRKFEFEMEHYNDYKD